MLDAIVDLGWRAYPSALIIASGALLLSIGTRKIVAASTLPAGDTAKMLTVVRGFRIAVVGLALAGLGAAWAWHVTWPLVLSLVFGGEELLESTTHISILKRAPVSARRDSAGLGGARSDYVRRESLQA